MSRKLVIVESPAKARTLGKILGKGFVLKASLGHVRDLPRSRIGVDIEHDFTPKYVVPRSKAKLVSELKKAVSSASTVFLATDPDREGEAIAWHLAEVMNHNSQDYQRVVFHEITDTAVKEAFRHPRHIDMHLVNAQQARRILDRLVGYKISPLLWKNVRRGLSAGRVQSVAVKIIVDREEEINKFDKTEYWTVEAELTESDRKDAFRASLIGSGDGTKLEIHDSQEADKITAALRAAAYQVKDITTRKATRQPAPPFITSTLQQEAARKLRFSARQTMAIAQQLYEGLSLGAEGSVGLITYMRTDSTRVAASALAETRDYIGEKYGPGYLPPRARVFTRRAVGAQEAHEAIRPTVIHREPEQVRKYLDTNQFKLYDLIWKRMVASQMAAAQFENTSVDINADNGRSFLLRSSASVNTFPGFIALYTEGRDDAVAEERSTPFPKLAKGNPLKLIDLFPEQRFTQPPPRYTEATLIKALEQAGIGRPSTYAPIISTIQERDYVTRVKGSFQPTEMGVIVNRLLSQYFPWIVNIKFTARLETYLDDIASDKRVWTDALREFQTDFEKSLNKANEQMDRVELPAETTDETCPKCGKPMVVKVGRFGKFLACSGYPDCKTTKPFRVKTGAKCPECGQELVQKMSKKKRVFYGCSGYPECTFATNRKPLPEPCPKCGGLLTRYGKQARCLKCAYRGKIEQE
ncbi:MAG: type I DNA topoisomerase [Chloroflexota bacterium]